MSSAPATGQRLRTGSPARGCRRPARACRSHSGAGMQRDERSRNAASGMLPHFDVDARRRSPARAHAARAWAARCRAARYEAIAAARCARGAPVRAPRSVSSRLSGKPDRCAPTTATDASACWRAAAALRCARHRRRRLAPSGRPVCVRESAAPSSASMQIAAGRADQRDAERQAVGAQRRRHRDRRVDRAGSRSCVYAPRLRLSSTGSACICRDRCSGVGAVGTTQHVDVVPQRARARWPAPRSRVARIERSRSALSSRARRRRCRAPSGRARRVVRVEEARGSRRGARRPARSFVEQSRPRRASGAKSISTGACRRARASRATACVEGASRRVVAEELELSRRGTPKREAAPAAARSPAPARRAHGSTVARRRQRARAPRRRRSARRSRRSRAIGRRGTTPRVRRQAARRLRADDVVEARPARGPSPRCRCRARSGTSRVRDRDAPSPSSSRRRRSADRSALRTAP